MARPLRVAFPGAVYHLTSRGNRRQAIFRTDGGNYIADLSTGHIEDPHILDCELKKIPGLIENGLFLNLVNKVVVANDELADIITFR